MGKTYSCFTDTVVCRACGLTQYVRVRSLHTSPRCRRCRQQLSFMYTVIHLTGTLQHDDHRQFVGTLVRSMRLRHGWSQAALAKAALTGRSRINRIERGRILPSVASFVRILSAFGADRICFRITRRAACTSGADRGQQHGDRGAR